MSSCQRPFCLLRSCSLPLYLFAASPWIQTANQPNRSFFFMPSMSCTSKHFVLPHEVACSTPLKIFVFVPQPILEKDSLPAHSLFLLSLIFFCLPHHTISLPRLIAIQQSRGYQLISSNLPIIVNLWGRKNLPLILLVLRGYAVTRDSLRALVSTSTLSKRRPNRWLRLFATSEPRILVEVFAKQISPQKSGTKSAYNTGRRRMTWWLR